jgi:MFS family permease
MAALFGGIILLGLFVQRCRTVANPLLDLSLFKLPFVVAANISGLFFSIGFLGMWLLNTQWIQAIWEYSPARSGLATAPGPIMAAMFAAPMGRVAVKWGHARVLMVGAVLLSFGTFMLTITMGPEPAYLTHYLPWMIITGIGVGCSMSTLSSSASAFLPPSRFAMGSALNTTCCITCCTCNDQLCEGQDDRRGIDEGHAVVVLQRMALYVCDLLARWNHHDCVVPQAH